MTASRSSWLADLYSRLPYLLAIWCRYHLFNSVYTLYSSIQQTCCSSLYYAYYLSIPLHSHHPRGRSVRVWCTQLGIQCIFICFRAGTMPTPASICLVPFFICIPAPLRFSVPVSDAQIGPPDLSCLQPGKDHG